MPARPADQMITPLHWAALRGHGDSVVTLLNKGADINGVAHSLFSPRLPQGPQEGFIPPPFRARACIGTCLARQCPTPPCVVATICPLTSLSLPNISIVGDSEGHTALLKAAQYGQTHVCQVNIQVRGCARIPMRLTKSSSCTSHHLDEFLSDGEFSHRTTPPLYMPSRHERLNVPGLSSWQLLISRGCRPDQLDVHRHSALHWACYMGRLVTAQVLSTLPSRPPRHGPCAARHGTHGVAWHVTWYLINAVP